MLLRDALKNGVFDHAGLRPRGDATHAPTWASERGVSDNCHVIELAELNKFLLLKIGVQLYLVARGHDLSVGKYVKQQLNVKVGYTDVFR